MAEDRNPVRAVESYLECVSRHETTQALAHLRDDFQLEFPGGHTLKKAGLEQAMGWDVGTEGRLTWTIAAQSGGEVTVVGEEVNEFLRLLGSEPLAFRSRFAVDDAGRIVRQRYEVEWSKPSIRERLEPVVAWAREHARHELADIYPDGRLIYTEEMGRRWVALLRSWRSSGEVNLPERSEST